MAYGVTPVYRVIISEVGMTIRSFFDTFFVISRCTLNVVITDMFFAKVCLFRIRAAASPRRRPQSILTDKVATIPPRVASIDEVSVKRSPYRKDGCSVHFFLNPRGSRPCPGKTLSLLYIGKGPGNSGLC